MNDNLESEMHTISEVETNVPAFLGKLWKLVEDPETDDLICWAPSGRSFFIRNQAQFARELLPHYYKHNNMASFVRQLNMYGFHKKVSVDVGGLKCERDEMEFAHQYFIKDHAYLLDHIKRKIAPSKSQDRQPPVKSELMNKVLGEVRTMRGRQEHLDSRLGAMKRENEALWRELAMLRRKHLKQQEIVNKLIHFLVTLVQPNRNSGLSVKRRYPLMIDHHQRNKQMKMNKPTPSPTGPVIHELDASEHDQHEQDLDSEYIVAEMLETQQNPELENSEFIDAACLDNRADTVQFIDCSSPLKRELQLLEKQEEALSEKNRKKPKSKKQEEVVMLDLNTNPEPTPQPPQPKSSSIKKTAKNIKSIPPKSFRSSKLAAMAANINKMNEAETDVDVDSDELADDPKEMIDVMDIADMLVAPDALINTIGGVENEKEADPSEEYVNIENRTGNEEEQVLQNVVEDAGVSGKSNDLSVSCVNGPGLGNTAYREEVDNHLETIQSDLDKVREMLCSEGYSIDANALLGLFGNDDPMAFGIPMNSELDPTLRDKDYEDGQTGGELMAYNAPNNLLEFDDDVFLDAVNMESGSSLSQQTNPFYDQDPLELGDNKALLFDSLISENDANSNAST